MPLLNEILKDATSVRSNSHSGTRYYLQVRDIAMIQLLKLHGLNPAKFGFEQYEQRKNMASNYQLGFVNNTKRDAAYKRCQEAIRNQKKKPAKDSKE